jgi:hypothetical protein
MKSDKTGAFLALNTVLVLLSFSGCRNESESRQQQSTPLPAKASTNLQLVLEGPFAVCTAPPGHQGKFQILVPKDKRHFEPGFDADVNETLLCEGDYSLNLGTRKPGRAEIKTKDSTRVFDTVAADCPPKSTKYLTLLVDKPDQIVPLTPTTATVTGANALSGQQEYVTRMLLYYDGVDPNSVHVEKLTPERCMIPIKKLGGTRVKKEFTFDWTPSFVNLGGDVRLLFGMMPMRRDNYSHSDAKAAYGAIAKMLNVNRKVDFPKPGQMDFGSHSDCRAPQVLVKPLENTQ